LFLGFDFGLLLGLGGSFDLSFLLLLPIDFPPLSGLGLVRELFKVLVLVLLKMLVDL
jgi:hypothetical protein